MQKYQQLKVFILGFIAAVGVMLLVSATNQTQPLNQVGTYELRMNDDHMVILNTVTGEYIIHFDGATIGNSKANFRKSTFEEKFKESKKH